MNDSEACVQPNNSCLSVKKYNTSHISRDTNDSGLVSVTQHSSQQHSLHPHASSSNPLTLT